MTTLLIIVHVLVCLFLIGIVLLQHGKGADIGATFGGSSQSLFGSEGPVPLLNKITTFSAIIFMGTSVSLAYLSANRSTGTVMSELKPIPVEETIPAPETTPVTIPLPSAPQSTEVKKEESKPQPAQAVQEANKQQAPEAEKEKE